MPQSTARERTQSPRTSWRDFRDAALPPVGGRLSPGEIEATVVSLGEAERQLWEIDENLMRADLTELEQSEHLLKRQEIYEWWRPETKRGGDRGNQHTGGKPSQDDNLSFSQDTAAKTGIDQRTVQRSTRRAKKIDRRSRGGRSRNTASAQFVRFACAAPQ
jgi:hypothetical protein